MKIFIAIVKKANSNNQITFEKYELLIKNIAKKQFPVLDFKSVSFEKNINKSNSILSFVFSNEKNNSLIEQLRPSQIGIKLGHSDSQCEKIFAADGSVRLDTIKNSSGQFSFIGIDETGVDIITDSVGSISLFTAECMGYYIIGSRINIIADLIYSITNEKISHDLLACRDFALQGHYLGRRTGYAGIESTSVHEHVRVSFLGISRESWLEKNFNETDFNSTEYSNLVTSISESLIDAMSILKGQDLHLSITGGRDSRLLSAILSNLPDINVTTATSGFEDNPDVILGRLVSEKLGWTHNTIVPKIIDSTIVVENPIERVRRTLDVHDGSTSAWDDCPDYGSYSFKPTMSGVGGEILRGGMTLISKEYLADGESKKILLNTMCGGTFFKDEIQCAALESSRALIMKSTYAEHAALDEYYHIHRNHRWVCNRRNGARLRWNIFDPLLDNKVVSAALAISPKQRWTERLVFDIIAKLNPSLRDLPIEGERWRFERSKLLTGDSTSWNNRFALKTTTSTKRKDWRNINNATLRLNVSEVIMDLAATHCSDLFNLDELHNYITTTSYSTTVWHLLTTTLFMSRIATDNRSRKFEDYELYLK